MVYFCSVNGKLFILTLILLITATFSSYAQQKNQQPNKVYLTPMTVYEGDTIPYIKLPTVYIFKPLKFKNKRARTQYYKLVFSQGKLLIKLVDRQTHSTGYELVKAFLGTFRAGFYQTFAALFGASLKKEYDATGDDALTERVILLVESRQL